MTIQDALSIGDSIPMLDREVLLAAIFQQNRAWLLAHGQDEMAPAHEAQYKTFIERRGRGEPVAYMLGAKEFYGRPFSVSSDVLIPRPATEELVEQALKMIDGKEIEEVREIDTGIVAWSKWKQAPQIINTIVDVGTGSGCIAITLACEKPHIHSIAIDTSQEALTIAGKNAHHLGVDARIQFMQGSLLESLKNFTQPFLLVSNPPYIPDSITLERDVSDFEPHQALFAGKQGIDVLKPLIKMANLHPYCVGWTVECRSEQVAL